MHEQTRRRLALVALAVAALALIATSPASGTTASFQGESVVSPDRPASIDVQFRVTDVHAEIQGIDLRLGIPTFTTDRAMGFSPSVRIDGVSFAAADVGFPASVEACADGCTVDVHVDLSIPGPPAPESTVRWTIGLFVNAGSPDSVRIGVSSPQQPAGPDRFVWYALGLALGALSGVLWWRAGRRFRVPRLGLAAGMAVLVGWFVLYDTGWLFYALTSGVALPEILTPTVLLFFGVPGAVIAAVAIGLWRHTQGHGVWLAVTGDLYLLAMAIVGVTDISEPPAYRPYEVTLLGLLIVAPGAAAITSVGLLPSDRRPGLREAHVVASQVLLIAAAAGVAAVAAMALAAHLAGPYRTDDVVQGVLWLGVAAAAAGLQFEGLRRWQQGRRRLLVTLNLIIVPLAGLALFFSFAVLQFGGLFLLVPAVVLLAAALVGVVLGGSVTPRSLAASASAEASAAGTPAGATPPQPEGQQEGREGEEVGRVGDKGDGPEVGKGS